MTIEDEMRRRAVRDVERTSARPVPKEVNVGKLVIAVVVIAIVGLLIWIG